MSAEEKEREKEKRKRKILCMEEWKDKNGSETVNLIVREGCCFLSQPDSQIHTIYYLNVCAPNHFSHWNLHLNNYIHNGYHKYSLAMTFLGMIAR